MTERSRFWNGNSLGDASAIAPYDSYTEFAEVMMAIAAARGVPTDLSGALIDDLNELAPTVSAPNAQIASGRGLVYGTWYENTASVNVNIPTPAVSNRYDRVVLRKSWTAQTVRITRIAGVVGGGIPAMTQVVGTTWDMPICTVLITPAGTLTLERDDRNFVPYLELNNLGLTIPKPNLLINPGFEVWQRSSGAFAVTGYTADQWYQNIGAASTMSTTREGTIISSRSQYSARVIYTHAAASRLSQTIENGAQYGVGQMVFRCAVRANAASAVRLRVTDGAGNISTGQYHSGDDTFQTLEVRVSNAVAGGTNLRVDILFEATVTAYIDNAILVYGLLGMDYVPLSVTEDYERCYRYYERLTVNSGGGANRNSLGAGYAVSATQGEIHISYYEKRISPTITIPTPADFSISDAGGYIDCTNLTVRRAGPTGANLISTVAAGQTTGRGVLLSDDGTNAAFIEVDASLQV